VLVNQPVDESFREVTDVTLVTGGDSEVVRAVRGR
jgi:hypothetical protein